MKIFIYTDEGFELDKENVFLSLPYKDQKRFEKENPGMKVLLSYDYEEYVQEANKCL